MLRVQSEAHTIQGRHARINSVGQSGSSREHDFADKIKGLALRRLAHLWVFPIKACQIAFLSLTSLRKCCVIGNPDCAVTRTQSFTASMQRAMTTHVVWAVLREIADAKVASMHRIQPCISTYGHDYLRNTDAGPKLI